MGLTELRLEDKEKIESIRKKYKHYTSSHSFISMYIWRKEYKLSLYLKKDIFTVKCEALGDNAWFFPCGSYKEKMNFISDNVASRDFILCYLREEDVKFLEQNFPGCFEFEGKNQDDEYLYSRLEWEELKGRKYAGIRNHIRRALKDNELKVEDISDENISQINNIISIWNSEKKENADEHAAMELMKYYKEWDVRGIIVYVNNEPYAVVAGFAISEDMYDMCLAKQKGKLSGLSVYAKHSFITNLPENYSIINAEEDLGIQGLRTMKQQMQPIDKIKMYTGRIC